MEKLSDFRLAQLERLIEAFSVSTDHDRLSASDVISPKGLESFGDLLAIHHCFSNEPFSKDKFEYALERVLQDEGHDARLASRGSRGFDIEIHGERFSLKTEASKAIRVESLHISKFMELGGGQWGDDPGDLIGLRDQFLALLNHLDRILVLRSLKRFEGTYVYELVEIPVELLRLAASGRLEMKEESRQMPRPGYCYIEDGFRKIFALYFDGGGERKLQIKSLPKSLCLVHAVWKFHVPARS